MKRTMLAVLAAALVVPAAAAAGGWATAGLAPPPDDIEAGQTWHAKVTLLQHGRTPLDGVSPSVIIRNDDGAAHAFQARPTGEPGVYVARVKFPSAGTWRYVVDDDFSATHTFAPVDVAPAGGTASDGTSVSRVGLGVVAAATLATLGLLLLRRRRAAAPQPA